jgi:CAAX protease family protein
MQLTEHFYPLLLFLPLAAASLSLWSIVIQVRFATPLFAPRSAALPKNSLVLIATGLLLVMLQILLPAIFFQLNPIGPDASELSRNLYKVRAGVAVDFSMLAIGFLAIVPLLRDERRLIGLHLENPKAQCQSGVVGFTLAILPVALIVAAVAYFKTPDQIHSLLQLIQKEPSFEVIAWSVLSAVVAAPLSEELLYRVLFQEGLIVAGYSPRLVIPGVAIFFCLNHANPNDPSSFLQTLPLLPLALLLGWVYHSRNSYLASVLMHMLFNTFNILILLATLIENPPA